MATKVPQTADELQGQLDEQLGFLRVSADTFDRGVTAEAKRLATTLRVLLHQTHQSTSLLTHLGMSGRQFLDSATPTTPGNMITHSGLVAMAASPTGHRFVPLLDDPLQSPRMIAFDDWWNATVIVDSQRRAFSRRDLVLALANQDGGAHVGDLQAWHADMNRNNSMAWETHTDSETGPLLEVERASVRQIAHEVLRSLDPGYSKMPNVPGVVLGNATLRIFPAGARVPPASPPPPAKTRPTGSASTLRRAAPRVGRNDPCPCGSGKKYKKCQGT